MDINDNGFPKSIILYVVYLKLIFLLSYKEVEALMEKIDV